MKNEIKEDFPIQISSAVVAPTAKEVEVGDIDEALENNLDLSQCVQSFSSSSGSC